MNDILILVVWFLVGGEGISVCNAGFLFMHDLFYHSGTSTAQWCVPILCSHFFLGLSLWRWDSFPRFLTHVGGLLCDRLTISNCVIPGFEKRPNQCHIPPPLIPTAPWIGGER